MQHTFIIGALFFSFYEHWCRKQWILLNSKCEFFNDIIYIYTYYLCSTFYFLKSEYGVQCTINLIIYCIWYCSKSLHINFDGNKCFFKIYNHVSCVMCHSSNIWSWLPRLGTSGIFIWPKSLCILWKSGRAVHMWAKVCRKIRVQFWIFILHGIEQRSSGPIYRKIGGCVAGPNI